MDFKKHVGNKIKITLSNGFIYYGFLLSVGESFLKINTDKGETFIAVSQICSMEEA